MAWFESSEVSLTHISGAWAGSRGGHQVCGGTKREESPLLGMAHFMEEYTLELCLQEEDFARKKEHSR